jgi:hypothetical protein
MTVMHHPELRVNAKADPDDEVFAIYAERGWKRGEHPDTDLDDPTGGLRRVLPAAKPAPKTPKPKD